MNNEDIISQYNSNSNHPKFYTQEEIIYNPELSEQYKLEMLQVGYSSLKRIEEIFQKLPINKICEARGLLSELYTISIYKNDIGIRFNNNQKIFQTKRAMPLGTQAQATSELTVQTMMRNHKRSRADVLSIIYSNKNYPSLLHLLGTTFKVINGFLEEIQPEVVIGKDGVDKKLLVASLKTISGASETNLYTDICIEGLVVPYPQTIFSIKAEFKDLHGKIQNQNFALDIPRVEEPEGSKKMYEALIRDQVSTILSNIFN